MAQSDRDETETPPPTYSETMLNTDPRNKRIEQCAIISDTSIKAVNRLLVVVFTTGFLLLMFTDVFPVHQTNMTQYCDLPDYNIDNTPKPFGNFEFTFIGLVLSPCISVIVLKFCMLYCQPGKVAKRFLWEFSLTLMHLVFLTTLITALKLCFGIPRPQLFGSEELKHFYCDLRSPNMTVPTSLKATDYHMRTSFPSFRSSLYTFAVTFTYLYFDHIDTEPGMHSTQQIIVIILGAQICGKMIELWENGDNRLVDLLGGAAIGAVYGVIAIRTKFGYVFHRSK